LVLEIYKLIKFFPRDELFALVSQIKRSAVSVPANIVEGYRRRSVKESLQFYFIANSSLEELRYHMFLAKDLKYIDELNYKKIEDKMTEVSCILNAWIKSQYKNYQKINKTAF
jgi:four helix bundle protein